MPVSLPTTKATELVVSGCDSHLGEHFDWQIELMP